MLKPYFKSNDKNFYLLKGDTFELLPQFEHQFDMVFADPPYFLSNNGLSIQNGKIVSVNKGKWDKSEGFEFVNDFNRKWLSLVREKMKDDATIWISGTMHNIFSVGQLLTELGFKILNVITWQKTNPPPNFSCRYFTYSTEQIIWARKHEKVPHYFNYELMKQLNEGKQMKDVWTLPAIAPWEKSCGKHPTQKPLSVLTRLILASTKPNAWVLDPFTGSSTTGIAANLANRRFLGIDQEEQFLEISKQRRLEIENPRIARSYTNKIRGFEGNKQYSIFLAEEPKPAKKIILGYVRASDLKKLEKNKKFYFHSTDKEDNFIGFPYDLYDAEEIILYTGGRRKPFEVLNLHATIKKINHKPKSKIKGKEKSKISYYFELELQKAFSTNKKLKKDINFKKLIKKYKKDYNVNKVVYRPILVEKSEVLN